MKRIMIIISLLLIIASGNSYGQTWNEWFKQKKTQRRYLRKQIALLKVYLGYLKEGYEIADNGLTLIGDIKDGDFSLHKDYFGSLKKVNPYLSKSAQVADVFEMQVQVVHRIQEVKDFVHDNEYFSPEEIHYLSEVYLNMLRLTGKSIDELYTIITSNDAEMTDDERLDRIGKLHADMCDKAVFVQRFAADVRLITAERERQRNTIEFMKKQYEPENTEIL